MTGKWQVGKNQRTPSHSFIFSLRESAGLTPRQNPQGGIDFVNGQGQSVFGFDPPTVHDGSAAARAAGAVSLTLGQSSSGTTVTLTVDSTWLGNPGRVFPVVVDPDFTPHHPDRSCYIGSGSYANTNSCTSSELDLGYDGSNAFRTLLHFSVDYLEPNVQVDEAQLGLYVYHHSTNNTTPIGAYQLTHSWTNGVTWNTYDGTNPWTTPGGDFSATPAYTADGVGGSAGWVYWYPSRLVKSWVNGTQYESGFLLKEPSESVTNVMDAYSTSYSNSAYWPSLRIFWEPRLGDQPWHPMIRMNLTDRMNLGVNAANGNLYLHQQDLTMPGVGLDNTVDRYYNSKGFDLSSAQDLGAISEWRLGLMDTYSGVGAWDDGSVGFTDAGGTAWMFYQNPDDSYTPPPGIDAQLQFINGVGYKLTYNRSAKVLNFTGYGNTASVVDRSGITLAYAYNANHEPSQITDTLGKATTFGYSGTTITSITDPASRVYGYGYNGNNQLTSYTDANTKVTQYAYGTADPMTGHSVLTKIIDPNGNITKIVYDNGSPDYTPDPRVSSIIRCRDSQCATSYTWTFTYHSGNTVVTDPNGHTWTYGFDADGRETSVTDQDSHQTKIGWTGDNQVLSVQLPSGHTTTYTYSGDGKHNLTQVQEATGASSSCTYANAGFPYLPDSCIDAQGNRSTFGYSSQGVPNSITDGNNHTSTAIYNLNGIVQSTTDGNSHTTSYGYFGNGLLQTVTPPSVPAPNTLGPTSFVYNSYNLPQTVTDGKSQIATYSYDPLNRPTGAGYADHTSVGYALDNEGNVLSMADGTGTTNYQYNALSQQTKKTLPNSQTVNYSWDGAGNLLNKTDGSGTTTYGYNAEDGLTDVTDAHSNHVRFGFDQDGNWTSEAFPNGVTQSVGYDAAGHLTSIGARKSDGTQLTAFTYGYDKPNTNPVLHTDLRWTETDMIQGNTLQTWSAANTFDAANQVTDVLQSGSFTNHWQYGFDPAGNRTSVTANGSQTTLGYNAADELTQMGSTTYSYDGNGNRMGSSAGQALSYNAQDQTTSITPPAELRRR